MPKTRLLHPQIAALLSELRHGEMICIADAGSGTSAAALVPLKPDVEIIDVAFSPNVPTLSDVLPVLWEVGDFEAAIVTEDMKSANPDGFALVSELVGDGNVHEVGYVPQFYQLRDRVKAVIQTGDYAVHGNVILVAGYPSPPIPMNWLTSSQWFDDAVAADRGGH
ncbi:RbsD/FucU domain-containing protein [Gordonia polyisoprenivorans]|uniref:RbsD/FucU domain-containing protein n=1 Tax=Gordonia polyisoprenivorans TaxID=84595 RepID=UPI000367E772|nr:RbsD/FucU domain-containing protein [Gordonia polyisoprenivorans]